MNNNVIVESLHVNQPNVFISDVTSYSVANVVDVILYALIL